MSALYVAYGSNMHRARLEARVGPVRDHGARWIAEHAHRFFKLGADGTAKGTLVAARDACAPGVLYELDQAQLAVLDRYEGGYRRARVPLLAGGDAITYLAERLVVGLWPTPSYLRHYLAGLREHGFSDQALMPIRAALWRAERRAASPR